MKITQAHYDKMKLEIMPLIPKLQEYREYLKTDNRVKDLEKRLRWDVMNAAGLLPFLCGELYTYLDDVHIDTALKNILKELEK